MPVLMGELVPNEHRHMALAGAFVLLGPISSIGPGLGKNIRESYALASTDSPPFQRTNDGHTGYLALDLLHYRAPLGAIGTATALLLPPSSLPSATYQTIQGQGSSTARLCGHHHIRWECYISPPWYFLGGPKISYAFLNIPFHVTQN